MNKLHMGSSLAILMMAGTLGAAYGADYTPVTDARLANPEPQNWLMTRGNYQGWSYSSLDQINSGNVKNLTPVWSVSTGVELRARSAADRQQRRDVRRHSLQPGDGAGRRHRRVPMAI